MVVPVVRVCEVAKGRLAVTRKLKALSGRLIVAVALACSGLLAGAGAAPAASCRWNPVCPFQSVHEIGGSDPASLDGPFGVALTPAGNVVVADYSRQDIREFTADGRLVRSIGTSGQFSTLRAIAVDHATGEIYASDYGCIYWFTPDGHQDGQRWCIGYDPKVSRQLTTIAVGPGGRLSAREDVFDPADTSTILENVITLGPDHQLTARWPLQYGHGDDVMPGAPFAVDGQGNVYLPSGGWVHEFSATGTFLGHIPLTVSEDAVEISGSTLSPSPRRPQETS